MSNILKILRGVEHYKIEIFYCILKLDSRKGDIDFKVVIGGKN